MAAIAGASGLINPSTIDLATSQADIERRRQLAMALLAGAGGMGQTQMAGNIAIRKSPFEFLTRLGTSAIGGHDLRALNEEQQGLVSSVQQRQADALQELFAAGQGTPATPAQADKGSFPAAEFDSSTPVVLPGQQAQPPDVNRMSAAVANATHANVDPKIMADQLSRWQDNMDLPPQMQPWNNGPVGGLGMNAGGDFTDASGAASPQAAAMAQALGSGGGGGASAGAGGTFMGLPIDAARTMLSHNPRLAALGKESIDASKAVVNRPGSQLTNPLTGQVISSAPPEGYQWTDKSMTTLRKIPGYTAGKAEEAGAVTTATAAARAPFDFVDVKFSDGSVQTMNGQTAMQVLGSVPGTTNLGLSRGPFPVSSAAPARASGGGQGASGRGAVLADEYRKQSAAGQVDPALATEISGLNRADRAAFDAAQSGAPGTPQVRPAEGGKLYSPLPPPPAGSAPIAGRSQSPADAAEAKVSAEERGKQMADIDDKARAAMIMKGRQTEMRALVDNFTPNAGAPYRQKVAEWLKAAGASDDTVTKVAGGNLSAMQAFAKQAVQVSFDATAALTKRPAAAEVIMQVKANPNIAMNVEAIHGIMDYNDGMFKYHMAHQEAKNDWEAKYGNTKGFEGAWNKSNDIENYVPSKERLEALIWPNGKPNPSTKVNNQTRTGAVGGSGQAAPASGLPPGWSVTIK